MAILDRITLRGNYKIRDNIFGAIVGEAEAYLGSTFILSSTPVLFTNNFGAIVGEVEAYLCSLYVPSVSVNVFTFTVIHITSGFKSNDHISIT